MKIEEYRKIKKRSKYNATKTMVDGIVFHSKKEAAYYDKLKLAKRSGELINFYMQVPFKLPGNTTYRLDFLEIYRDRIAHTDVKGFSTSMFLLKKRQVEEIYNIKIEVI
jgi:hypothetical protein